MTIHLTSCPVCGAVNVYHPNEPVGVAPDRTNRCQFRALTGQPGGGNRSHRGPQSWWAPARYSSKLCLAPLVDMHGEPIPRPPLEDWLNLTRRPFDVSQLYERARGLAARESRNPAILPLQPGLPGL